MGRGVWCDVGHNTLPLVPRHNTHLNNPRCMCVLSFRVGGELRAEVVQAQEHLAHFRLVRRGIFGQTCLNIPHLAIDQQAITERSYHIGYGYVPLRFS